jgi:cytochrome c oxidase subunit 2
VDVIHSLFIPAFRVKEDVVPGDTTNIWFIPQREGTYEILCTEYCGLRHSYMEAKAKIVSQADYDAWLAGLKTQGEGEPEGLAILKKNACLGCHSLDGTKLVGPTFKGIFGKKETVIENGAETEITADSLYIISSILEPDKQVVKGFNKGLMRTYKGVIPDDEIMKAYQYLKSLNAE